MKDSLMSRRDFLSGLKKWSKVVVATAVVGSVAGKAIAAVWANGGGSWGNRGGSWGNSGGSWGNRGGGGWANSSRGGWINRRGGGGWANRY